MSPRIRNLLFVSLLTVTLFSVWAGFALLVVNKLFYQDLPGYTIGRLCIWELVALFVAAMLANILVKRWGRLEVIASDQGRLLAMNPKYAIYFGVYFLLAIATGIWQFWLFSLKF